MDERARAGDVWSFRSPRAELRRGALTACVDISQPGLGLHQLMLNGRPLDATLLRIGSDDGPSDEVSGSTALWPVADAYVRGNDLVATYQPRADFPFSPQVYWEANASQCGKELFSSLSLFVSVQTHLLDTWPRINFVSRVAADQALHVTADTERRVDDLAWAPDARSLESAAGPFCILQRIAGEAVSYAEIVPASDFRQVTVQHDGATGICRTRWELFADFLEKGVIWRARLHAVMLPRENDVELARACCRALVESPLPLTT